MLLNMTKLRTHPVCRLETVSLQLNLYIFEVSHLCLYRFYIGSRLEGGSLL
jgi:hypothetical protein